MRYVSLFEVILLSIVAIAGIYLFTYTHELTHQQIFSYYNIDSNISVGFGTAVTIPDENQIIELYREDPDIFWRMNTEENMVDVVGYQLLATTAIIVVMMIIMILSFRTIIAEAVNELIEAFAYGRDQYIREDER